MSRKAKKAAQATPAAPAKPPAPTGLSGRPCDDPLTLVVERMRPSHRIFADAILRGERGTAAAELAGFSPAFSKSQAVRLLRRPDVRRYIHLHQEEAGRASRVSLATLVDRLFSLTCDPTVNPKRQDLAMAQLVRIFTAAAGPPGPHRPGTPTATAAGLTEEVVGTIEAQILGVTPG